MFLVASEKRMNIRILRPDGVLNVVDRVFSCMERIEVWNGKKRRSLEIAKEYSKANALVVIGGMNCCFTIGNLLPSQVREIQQNILVQGYVDFMALGCKITKEREISLGKEQSPYFCIHDRQAHYVENTFFRNNSCFPLGGLIGENVGNWAATQEEPIESDDLDCLEDREE